MRLIDADRLMRSIDINWGCDECKAHCVDAKGMALCEIHQFKECVVAEPTDPQWIPVSERLPVTGDAVIFSTIYNNVDIGVKDSVGWDTEEGWYRDQEVIAWMPLPEPFKGSDPND